MSRLSLTREGTPRRVKAMLVVVSLLTGAHLGHAAIVGGGGEKLFVLWIYGAVMVGCALVCAARGLSVRESRVPWLVLGGALCCDATAEMIAVVNEALWPAVQAALFLCFYLGCYVGIVQLGRRRVRHARASLWLDGLSGALAIGAIGVTALFDPVFASVHGHSWQTLLDIAYPLLDTLLVGVVVGMLALAGWRFDRAFALIAVGFLVLAVTDGIYLYQVADNTYVPGTPLDSMWLVASVLLAFAAWQPDAASARESQSLAVLLASPVISAVAAIGVLTYDSFNGVSDLSMWLAVGTLLAVVLRLVSTGAENARLVRRSHELAHRDALTGLGNRRALFIDLEAAVATASRAHPRLLVLFDLNGFKHYNDTFGHPAGDALLTRLGEKLQRAADPFGSTYRLGGDEFCVLVRPEADPPALAAELAAKLLDNGEEFTIGTSYGEVLIGAETSEISEALRIADQRLYAQKAILPRAARLEWRDVLLGVLRERDGELDEHVQEVARLALEVGKQLEVKPGDLRAIVAAAELHDIGKTAIPEAILQKPGPLDATERAFIERHTVIGERILGSAPSLAPVGAIVRSTHERWDGHGYPDRLQAEEIPLAARIIAICDAYHAMTSDRVYRRAMSAQAAIAELRTCAGSQFDPTLVELFIQIVSQPAAESGLSSRTMLV